MLLAEHKKLRRSATCTMGVLLLLAPLACSSEVPEAGLRQGGSGAGAGAVSASGASAGGVAPGVGGLTEGPGGTGVAGVGGFAGSAGSLGAGGASLGGAAGAAAAGMGGTQGPMDTGPAKVLCLGDSITEQPASWIYPLQDALRATGCGYELIGLTEGPYNGPYTVRVGYDNERVAAGGFSTTGILNLIKERGTGGVPDIVVEYLGVNNAYGGFIDGKYNPDNRLDPDGSFITDNKQLFARFRAENPKVTFLLMKIENHALPEIDAAIDELASTASTAESAVLAVAVAEGVETEDGIHPTASGAATLAGPVGQALSNVLAGQGRCRL